MKYILRLKELMGMSTFTKLLYRKLFCKFYATHRPCYDIVKFNHNYDCGFVFMILWVYHHEFKPKMSWIEICDQDAYPRPFFLILSPCLVMTLIGLRAWLEVFATLFCLDHCDHLLFVYLLQHLRMALI